MRQNLRGRGAEQCAKNDYKVNQKAEREIEEIQEQLAEILAGTGCGDNRR
jgi:uncharacterized membrane protein